MAKKYKNKYMNQAVGTAGLGIGSMAGLGAMGAMGSMPGMPAGGAATIGIASSGMQLANIGNLANIGMNIMPRNSEPKVSFKKKKK
jgi:hypothetical protein